jgi:hypothetical protein
MADDGDVIEDGYLLDTTANNYFYLDVWDTVNKRAQGRFQASYTIRKPIMNGKNAEKVTFSSGKFWVKLP